MTSLAGMYRPKDIDGFIGQVAIMEKIKEHVFDKPPEDCPNLYFWGMNGVGKTTLLNFIVKHVAGDWNNVLAINSGDEGVIATIRGKVKQAAQHMTLSGGERIIWFKEAYLLTAKSIEALKEMIEEYDSVKWFFDSNRRIDRGLERRCSGFHFKPIEDVLIRKRLLEIRDKEKFKIPDERIDHIIQVSLGNLAKAINQMLSAPTENITKELFTSAINDFDSAYQSYLRARPHPADFLEEGSVLVATNTKMDNSFKMTIIQQIAIHYNLLVRGVPDTVVMGSMLSIINEEGEKL